MPERVERDLLVDPGRLLGTLEETGQLARGQAQTNGPARSRRRHSANSAKEPLMDVRPMQRIGPDQLNGRDSVPDR